MNETDLAKVKDIASALSRIQDKLKITKGKRLLKSLVQDLNVLVGNVETVEAPSLQTDHHEEEDI